MAGAAATLAGRAAELRAVSALLGGETDAIGMLVVGEAGVGKSRLVSAAAAAATTADVLVLSGWCLRLSEGLPFLPIVDVLSGLREVDESRLVKAALAECPTFVASDVLRLMPDLAEAPDQSAAVGSDSGWRRQRLFEGLRRLLAVLAQLRRVAIVIDDLQWADASTLDLLDYLLAPGHATGVPMVLSWRSEDTQTPTLVEWLDRMQRRDNVRRLDLAPMSENETAEQIEMMLGTAASRTFVSHIYARSEGNAFFTEQLVAAGAQHGEDRVLPAGLTSLLLSRSARVSGTARQVLAVLAVAGQPLDEVALARLCDQPELNVREALHDLLSRHLLRHPDRTGGYQLRHALLAEAVSEDLLPGERRELHARVGELMTGWNDLSLAVQIAQHFAAAGRPADEFRWRVLSGRQAEAVYASAEAATHWLRVLALWDHVPDPRYAADLDLIDVYQRAWTTVENAGDEVAAGLLAEQAFARLAATASPQTNVRLHRAVGHFRGTDFMAAGLEALAQAVEIGERLPPDRDYVLALDDYAGQLQRGGHFRECQALTRRALQAARQIGDLAQQRLQLTVLAWVAMGLGNVDEAMAHLESALQMPVDAADDPLSLADAAVLRTDLLIMRGALESVVAVGLPALDRAERGGLSGSRMMNILASNVGETLIELGDLTRAAEVLDPVTVNSPSRHSLLLHASRTDLDMRRGRLSIATAFWETNRDLLASVSNLDHRLYFASRHLELSLWLGDSAAAWDEACGILQALCAGDYSRFAGDLFVLALRRCADEAERARASADQAALEATHRDTDRIDAIRASAHLDPFTAHEVPATASADAASWQAERSRLDGVSSAELWEDAAAAWDALPRPCRAGYARWRQVEALLASQEGRFEAAIVLRTAAGQAASHVPLSTAIHDLARRARIDLNDAAQAVGREKPPARAFGLTDREIAVLRLLADGSTNVEIAATLYMSPKTASVHVTHILRKLNVATRVQAATIAQRAGLLTDPTSSTD